MMDKFEDVVMTTVFSLWLYDWIEDRVKKVWKWHKERKIKIQETAYVEKDPLLERFRQIDRGEN